MNLKKEYSTSTPFKQLIFLALILATLQSCGEREKAFGKNDPSLGSIIIGSLDWKEITTLSTTSPIFENASFVGDVELPVMGSRCTGFLISEDVFMTNEHCVPSAAYARGIKVAFNHVQGVPEADWEKYDCSEFIGNNSTLDYALLRCAGSPGAQYGFAQLNAQEQAVGQALYVIQQNCDYYTNRSCDWSKKYSEGSITKKDDEYTHNADTLGGSSGSPVFSKTSHEVIAIHHAGLGNNGQGRGIENYAVPMDKIVRHINQNFPNVLNQSGNPTPTPTPDPGGQTDEEPNNSFADAKVVNSSEGTYQLEISDAQDEDYFKFELGRQSDVKVKISFSHSTGDLDMKLYDSSFSQLKVSQTVSDEEKFEMELPAGEYYVFVYGYRGAKGSYSMTLEGVGGAAAAPNDSFANAYNVFEESSGEITGAGEKDYFYFELLQASSVEVKMDIDQTAGDLDLDLYDENFSKIGSSLSVTKVEKITKSLSSGKYYVVVKGYRSATGGYQLSVQ